MRDELTKIENRFAFAGYQLRVRGAPTFLGTLADQVNSIYIPKEEPERSAFQANACGIPFFFTNGSELTMLEKILQRENNPDRKLAIFRCAILKDDITSAYTEFYDEEKSLTRRTFKYVQEIVEPQIDFLKLGLDVIATDIGGGVDSAIHTYSLCRAPLNISGLLDNLDEAIVLRDYANIEISEHAPFSVWSVGLISPRQAGFQSF